jgi:FkbM family methyltransferase
MPTSFSRPVQLPRALLALRRARFPRHLGLCERFFARTLAAHGVAWVRTAPGPVWKLDLTNPTHRWIVYGDYEGPALWRWLNAQGRNFRTVVDSGANIGQTVLYFAQLLPGAQIYAYEPGAAARAWLTECVAANGFSQVAIAPLGLGSAAGSALLADVGGADRHGAWNQVNTERGEPITLTTLDAEMSRHGVATLDLWKLDLEGYEAEALIGAAPLLDAGRIRAVYVEIWGEHGRAILDFMAARGYHAQRIARDGTLRPWTDGHECECALFLAPAQSPAPASRA